jgi:UDPglucose--hexose-1-phosphate uridylyltransferase
MPELRQDVVTGTWVVIASERAMRPSDFSRIRVTEPETGDCPFDPGHESMTPPEIAAVRPGDTEPDSPGWQVRVVPNKFPAFAEGAKVDEFSAMFPRRAGEGSHEVIIHTPDHHKSLATMTAEEVELVLRVYKQRYRVNSEKPDVSYIHIIVNHGRESGASLEHSHSQLLGVPLVPPLVKQELAGASRHYKSTGECVFCSLMKRELGAGARVVAETDGFVALAPFASRMPFEVWLIPRLHQESFGMISDGRLEDFARVLRDVLGRYRGRFDDPPYNYFIHSAPCDGPDYGYYHWHLEMFPKLTTLGAFELGTSMMINTTTPEHSAERLRTQKRGQTTFLAL